MASPPFVEMVENERGWGPLLVDKPSNKIRRDLLHGTTVWDGEKYGASRSLVNQVAAIMEDWGFKFERPLDEAGKHKGFKLINRDHKPESKGHKIPKRVKRVLPAAPPEAAPPNGNGHVVGRGHHGELRTKIRNALINGEALSDRDTQDKFGGSNGNLRRVIESMEDEGFSFDTYKGPTGKTFAAKANSRGMRKASAAVVVSQNGNGSNLPVPMFGNTTGHEVSIPPLPAFGGHIQVVGQHLGRDGSTVTIMLRDEEDSEWLVTVDGHEGVAE